jgi:hypothetical protein
MKKLRQIQISIEYWQKIKVYCAYNNVNIKYFIEKLIDDATNKTMQ